MTELHARAEVVGYPENILDAIRDLVREVNANVELAIFTGWQVTSLSELDLMKALGHLLTTIAGQAALTEGQHQ